MGRELKRVMEELKKEKEILAIDNHQNSISEEEVRDLKVEKRRLEERLTRLCESPFIKETFDQQEEKLKVFSPHFLILLIYFYPKLG